MTSSTPTRRTRSRRTAKSSTAARAADELAGRRDLVSPGPVSGDKQIGHESPDVHFDHRSAAAVADRPARLEVAPFARVDVNQPLDDVCTASALDAARPRLAPSSLRSSLLEPSLSSFAWSFDQHPPACRNAAPSHPIARIPETAWGFPWSMILDQPRRLAHRRSGLLRDIGLVPQRRVTSTAAATSLDRGSPQVGEGRAERLVNEARGNARLRTWPPAGESDDDTLHGCRRCTGRRAARGIASAGASCPGGDSDCRLDRGIGAAR